MRPCTAILALALAAPAAFAAGPAIQSVFNAASYQTGIASATWTAITGVNLSTTTRAWGTGDFTAGNLPTSLDGVQVTVNGKPAYVYFISPGQINILPPDDTATGAVNVQVTNAQGTSSAYQTNKLAVLPGLFAYGQLGGHFAIAEAKDFSLIAPPNLIGPTVTTATAAPGETLILYATGLGPTNPPLPTGQLITTPAPTASPVTVTVGGKTATVLFAGLIGSGLYQVNLVMPAVRTGDQQIVVSVGGRQSSSSVYVPVQAYGEPSGQSNPPILNCLSGQVDYVTESVARMTYGQADAVSIGGTQLCATCNIKPPLYSEFAVRLERAAEKKQAVQACYDKTGNIYQLKVSHP